MYLRKMKIGKELRFYAKSVPYGRQTVPCIMVLGAPGLFLISVPCTNGIATHFFFAQI